MSATTRVLADESPTPAAEQRPGYGVVQSITPVRAEMDDGSIQIRQLKARSVARGVAAGQRVLITNAGDVLPE